MFLQTISHKLDKVYAIHIKRLLNLRIIRCKRKNQKEDIWILFWFSIRLTGFPRMRVGVSDSFSRKTICFRRSGNPEGIFQKSGWARKPFRIRLWASAGIRDSGKTLFIYSVVSVDKPILVESSNVQTDPNPVSDFSSLALNSELAFSNISTFSFRHLRCRRFEKHIRKKMGQNIRTPKLNGARQFNTI